MQKIKYKPGNGWEYLGSSVWMYKNGTRIHVGGLLVMPLGKIAFNVYSESLKLIAINGGNKKRGLMAYARGLYGK